MGIFSKHNQPIGFTFQCPFCGSKRTFFSSGDDCWVCMDCERSFSRPQMAECDFCENESVCSSMTKMGTVHNLCRRHRLLYGVS